MRRRHTLYIPCEVFTVQVVSAPQKGLSTLEHLALEAVYHGAYNLDQLNRIFMLGHRPLLDLVSDLWRNNHLRIDVYDDKLYVTESVVKYLEESKAAGSNAGLVENSPATRQLEGGQRSIRRMNLVHDLICNSLLPEVNPDRLAGKADLDRQLHPILPVGSYRTLPLLSLANAVHQRFESREIQDAIHLDRQRQQLIHFSLLGSDGPEKVSRLRFLQVKVESVRSSTGRHRFQVVEPTFLSPTFRRRLAQRLCEILDEGRASTSVLEEILRTEGETIPGPLKTLPELMATVEQLVEALESKQFTSDVSAASRHHVLLREPAVELLAEIEHREEHEARIRWIRGQSPLDQEMMNAIGQANSQIVLSSPVIYWRRFRSFYETFQKRLQDGIRIVVLWGATQHSSLEIEVRNALRTLSNLGDLQWSFRSMRTHASFLLRDADLGIFSSAALFGEPLSGNLTAVVRRPATGIPAEDLSDTLEPSRHAVSVAAVVDELERVQRTALDVRIEQSITLPPRSKPAEATLGRRPPDLDPEIFSDDLLDPQGALTVWVDTWRRWVSNIRLELRDLRHSVTTVHDREHLDWLETAFVSRPPWMVLGGGAISSRVFDQAFERKLELLAQGGTRLLLVNGQRSSFDASLSKTLADLCRAYPNLVQLVDVPLCGGVLATEQFLLVTSFELLDRPPLLTSDPAQRSLHTGVLSHGTKPIHEGLVLLFGEHSKALRFLGLESGKFAEETTSQSLSVDPMAIFDRLRQDLLQALSREVQSRHQEIFDGWLQSLPRNVTALQAFRSVKSMLPPALAKYAQTATLYMTQTPLTEEAGPLHLRELATELWENGRFFEASRLFSTLENTGHHCDDVEIPSPKFLALLNTVDDEGFTNAVLEILDKSSVDAPLATACYCLAVQSLLTTETTESIHRDSWDLALHVENDVDLAWRHALQPLLDYYRATLTPIPWSGLSRLRMADLAEGESKRLHKATLDAFNQAANMSMNFSLGVLTWRRLFAEDGEFGSLRSVIESADREAAANWYRNWIGRGVSASEIMDATARQVFEEVDHVQEDAIIHRRRGNYVRRLDTLVERLGDWVRSDDLDLQAMEPHAFKTLRILAGDWQSLCVKIEEAIPTGYGWQVSICRAFRTLLTQFEDGNARRSLLWSEMWQEHAWRYPELWNDGFKYDLPPDQMVRAVLEGLIHPPKSPDDVLESMLKKGQVCTALRLAPLTDLEESEVFDRAAAGLRRRGLNLLSDLRTLDPSAMPMVDLSIASTQGGTRRSRLLEQEATLERLEARHRSTAAKQLPGAIRQFELGPIKPAPRLTAWPYSLSVAEVVRNLRDQPQTFGGWQPRQPAALNLIALWAAVLLDGEPVTRGWAIEFAESLGRLLGVEPTCTTKVERTGNFVVTWLEGLPASWPVPIRADNNFRRQMRIPCQGEVSDEPEQDPGSPGSEPSFFLLFDPHFDPRLTSDISPDEAVRIHPHLIFRTLLEDSIRTRRYTWACELGRQMPLDLLLPIGKSETRDGLTFLTDLLGELDPAHQISAFLELGGFRGWTSADVYWLVEITNGHPCWLRRYLEQLCEWLVKQGRDRTYLTSEVFGEIWRSGTFRTTVVDELDRLRQDGQIELAHILTHTAYLWIDGMDHASRPALAAQVSDSTDIEAGLQKLEQSGWVHQEAKNSPIRPPSAGIGTLIIDYILDHGEEIERQFSNVRQGTLPV